VIFIYSHHPGFGSYMMSKEKEKKIRIKVFNY
jgi:hypothetical protein